MLDKRYTEQSVFTPADPDCACDYWDWLGLAVTAEMQ